MTVRAAHPERRGALWTAARVAVAVAAAVMVVGAASRVNRPQRWRVLEEGPRVADVVLGEVWVDLRSPADALEAIGRAAPGRVRLEVGPLTAEPRREGAGPPQRLRDVRLGTGVEMAIGPRAPTGAVEVWETGGQIVVGGPGRGPGQAVEARVYDVRDLLCEITAWRETLPPDLHRSAPRLRGGGSGAFTGPTFATGMEDVAVEYVVRRIQETVLADQWIDNGGTWRLGGWGGFVFVEATADGHRLVERFLLLLRRGESGAARLKGAGS